MKIMISRREKITYATLILNVGFSVFAILMHVPPLEIAVLLGAIDAVVAWYLKMETDRKSDVITKNEEL